MDEILRVVGKLAPALVKSLIPGGPLVSAGIDMLGQALGIAAPNEDKLLAKIKNLTPEDVAAIKKAEFDFKAKMKELDIKEIEVHAGDRDSARKMGISLKGWTHPVLATVVVLGFFVIIAYVLGGWAKLNPTNAVLVGTLVGYASAKADQVISYYFGSSDSSAKKNELLAKK